jgi:hypothetical protein
VCTVTGFVTYVEALQFEWALHHAGRRWGSGLPGRWRKLEHVCGKERWTSTSPLATERPLMLTLFTNDTVPPLPPHITVKQSQTLFPV